MISATIIFSYACSLPVTWQRWRLHHSIHGPPYPKIPCCMQTWRFYVWYNGSLPIEVLHCGYRNFPYFRPFWLLWPWPWSDDLHIRTRSVDRGVIRSRANMNCYVNLSRLSKVIVWPRDIHTYTQTGMQTDRHTGGQECINFSSTSKAW